MLLGFTILCLATMPIALSQELHKRMTVDEVAEIFDATHDTVPAYQVVQYEIGRLNKREENSPRKLKLVTFDGEIDLFLNPTEGFLAENNIPVYTATQDTEGTVIYTVSKDAMENVGRLYEDVKQRASLVVGTNFNGQETVTGHIGSHNLAIKPVPDRLANDIVATNPSQNLKPSVRSRNARSAYHIVFKREIARTANYGKGFEFNETNSRVPRAAANAASTTVMTVPSVLYPEIMIVIDFHTFKKHSRDITKTLRYALAFWNGVDLLYRRFDQPKIRFNIAQFVIALTEAATPYVHNNRIDNTQMIKALEAHRSAMEYYYKMKTIFPTNSYDAVVTITGLQLTTDGEEADAEGIAQPNGACRVNDEAESVFSVAMITDDGVFTGVRHAAHEFAHLLGAKHDQSRKCPSAAGYIMSPASLITEHSHDFSECSVSSIDKFLNTGSLSCMYNEPRMVPPIPRISPASIINRNQQCHAFRQGDNCFTGAEGQSPCRALYCFNPKNPEHCREQLSYAPVEGAFCGTGKICVKGVCVAH